MPRVKRTIKSIESQRQRALDSLQARKLYREGNTTGFLNAYMMSQKDAYGKPNIASEQKRKLDAGDATLYALGKSRQREYQIRQAAANAIARLQLKGRGSRVARKAKGLSVG